MILIILSQWAIRVSAARRHIWVKGCIHSELMEPLQLLLVVVLLSTLMTVMLSPSSGGRSLQWSTTSQLVILHMSASHVHGVLTLRVRVHIAER